MGENKEEIEELEGEDSLNPDHNDVEDIYPNANIKIERGQFSIYELKRKYERRQIILNPDFQRNYVWNAKQKSEFIESILMGVPIPLIYLTENREGQLIVIDGKQRLTTTFEFLDNNFKLNLLRILPQLNGYYFKDLDSKLQANLEDYQIISHIIKLPTPDRIKFDIFDRVNRGGTQLNHQEMRNALYQGKSTKLLEELSKLEIFKKATSNSISPMRMQDRYIILRFVSFYLWEKNRLIEYRGDMDSFLGKSMEYINSLNDNELKELKEIFITAMSNSYKILGENAFKLPSDNRKKPINIALFETISFLLCNINEESKVKSIYNDLIEDRYFVKLLTKQTTNRNNVFQRFDIIHRKIEELKSAK